MTEQTAVKEAEQYVERLIKAQGELGYQRPKKGAVNAAVGEAAEAVRVLAALAKNK
jgi:hypothetical protein